MGCVGNGRVMSGTGIAIAGAGTSAPPPQPFNADFSWVGQNPLPISSSAGVAQAVSSPSYYANVLSYSASGGVTPYSDTGTTLSDPSGKIFLANSGDGIHTTLGWSNLTVNEIQTAQISTTLMDSAGSSKSFSISVAVHRVS